MTASACSGSVHIMQKPTHSPSQAANRSPRRSGDPHTSASAQNGASASDTTSAHGSAKPTKSTPKS